MAVTLLVYARHCTHQFPQVPSLNYCTMTYSWCQTWLTGIKMFLFMLSCYKSRTGFEAKILNHKKAMKKLFHHFSFYSIYLFLSVISLFLIIAAFIIDCLQSAVMWPGSRREMWVASSVWRLPYCTYEYNFVSIVPFITHTWEDLISEKKV